MKAVWYGITGLLAAFAAVIAWYSYDRMKSSRTPPVKPQMAIQGKTDTAPPKAAAKPVKTPEKKTAATSGKDMKDTAKAEASARTGPSTTKAEEKSKTGKQAKAQDKVLPSFDVVRVEPDGSAVIAGRAQPGWKVVVSSKGVIIGEAIANARGEWVIISDKPVSAGSSNLKLTASSPDNQITLASSQIVAISRPAATLKTPGKMAAAEIPKAEDTVKTGPDAPAASESKIKTSMKSPVRQKPEMTSGSDTAEAKRPVQTKPEAKDAAKSLAKPSSGEVENADTDPQKDIPPGKTAPETSIAGAKSGSMDGANPAPQATDSHPSAKPAEKTPDASAGKVSKLAEVTGEKPENPAPAKIEPEKAITEKIAPEKTVPEKTVAMAERKPETAPLKAAAPVPAEAKSPVANPATTTAPQPAKPLIVVSEPGKASRVLQTPAQESAQETMPLTFRSVDYNDKGQVILSGKAKPGALVRVYLNNDFIGSTSSNSEGVWELKTRTDVTPGQYTLRVDQIGHGNRIAARVEAPFKRAAPEAVKQARINGEVVIQPGDNLWNISRALYGHGVQYTIIYEANRNKIKDPDLIYPGQIFTTPGSNPVEGNK